MDQVAFEKFWDIFALSNYIGIGADATNAYTAVPPPVVSLFITPDSSFINWWTKHHKKDPLLD